MAAKISYVSSLWVYCLRELEGRLRPNFNQSVNSLMNESISGSVYFKRKKEEYHGKSQD